MSDLAQKMEMGLEPTISDEISVKIPKKGKIKPSAIRVGYSNLRIQRIQIHTFYTYIPGKITFEKAEE